MRFRGTVELNGKTATGLVVPDELIEALSSGARPKVVVTVGGHTFHTTIGRMGGRSLISLSVEHRQAAGVTAGDEVEVDIALDDAPREVEVPPDLATALAADDGARAHFDGLAFSHRKEWVRWIEEAKKPETRQARLEKTMAALRDGKRTR